MCIRDRDICSYSKEGRAHIHARQKGVSINILKYILENPIPSQSIEYNDNRLSLLVGQNGLCKISKEPVSYTHLIRTSPLALISI